MTLASASSDRTIRLWNAATGEPLGLPLTGHTDEVRSVAFSPDGRLLASGGSDNDVLLWDVTDRSQPRRIGVPLRAHSSKVHGVAFSPNGDMLVSGGADGAIVLWDVATRQMLGRPLVAHNDWVWTVAFSPDGHTVASGSRDTTLMLWEINADPSRACRIAGRNLTRRNGASTSAANHIARPVRTCRDAVAS